jgi:hypothetical protein
MAGSCYCGDVTFEVTATTLWCGHCHCTICQRIHGAGVVTWVGCSESAVEISDNQDSLKWYKSSMDSARGSCGHCGSQMFFRSERWPGELHIVRSCFNGDIDREPEGQAFYETHVSWLTLAENGDEPR